ncbi:MAG: DUF4249 domain-containing protein [Bacteroidetes bacterium]|nr:DUF4249 domain-containing protein [Bacteroidota bacterium]
MRIRVLMIVLICLIAIEFSCKKPYNPTIVSSNQSYLVVDGVINSGSDSTIIYLSRTVKLNSKSFRNPVQGASLKVESDKNDVYILQEVIPGKYVATNLNLPIDRNYRMHIFTSDNKEYVSDFVENKITPPIDSVYATPLTTGVQFSVSTHDNTNKTRYYRWDYTESWSYEIGEQASRLIYKNGQITSRSPDSLVNLCYKYPEHNSSIFLANSEKLTQDVISKSPLGYVDGSTGKITNVYEFLLSQYALTSEAYKYWTLLKTNNEGLGTITDPQPSQSITNIHCVTNPAEPVIGYVSVSTISLKRVFLAGRDLPFAVNELAKDSVSCGGGIIWMQPQNTFLSRLQAVMASGDTLLVRFETGGNGKTGYSYETAICADCRLRGGTTTKPAYWPSGL